MVHITKNIKCKFNGPDDYLPEGIPQDKFIPVIGYETRRREQKKNDKTIVVEDIFYLVINNSGKLISVASFNCITIVDDSMEKTIKQISNQFFSNVVALCNHFDIETN